MRHRPVPTQPPEGVMAPRTNPRPDIPLLIPDWPLPGNVRAIQTTRAGGVSGGSWSSLNLAAHTGDDPAAVHANRRILVEALELPAAPLWPRQVHGTGVADAVALTEASTADAVIARAPGAVCAVQTADCLPVLFCSRDGHAIAAAHAGWRGLAAGVLEATVDAMDAAPDAITAWLGPAIGPQAFEVGPEVRAAFLNQHAGTAAAFRPGAGDRWFADIYHLARLRLHQTGVTRIHGGGHCTFHEPDTFFSYRRNTTTGRMATLIWRTT